MNKIEKIHALLMKRLPTKYHIPIVMYKDTRTMFEAVATEEDQSLLDIFTYYEDYLKNSKKATYMNTKYYKIPRPKTAMDINALGSNPIKISTERIIKRTNKEIAFLLLHEIGHNSGIKDERKADEFAIRWIKKLIWENRI